MGTAEELGFDPDELRAKYRAERDKRLRDDGAEQYIELSGRFARFYEEDPYVDEPLVREPVVADVNVVIIGGGFSGLLAGARLAEAGVEDVHIVEAGADFGGTWYWNRYPGAQCDIESYCYLPLLEELGYMPKEKYSFAPEIYEHSRRIGEHYGLYDRTWFQTRVTSVDWDEPAKRWRLSTSRGDDLTARFVISALGPANRPKLPGIEGIDDFAGHSFHTARWDYDYTGGDTEGGMTGLNDKRVAIIGTGATSIQCVPRTARDAQHLYVFQRTPSSVDRRGNSATDPEWWASLRPGWQRARRENFAGILAGQPFDEDLVADGWTDIFRNLASSARAATSMSEIAELVELADFQKMNAIRSRVDDTVHDEETAEALKPYYRQMCKRPTFNDEYLPAFNQDNVTLVDVSEAKGVDRITERGVVANGVEYEVDCIIFASGFEITTQLDRRLGLAINGRDGVSLVDHWGEGIRSLHGFTTRGFPNWFYIGMSQNAYSVNMTQMFDEQAQHIAYLIRETVDRGATTIEPSEPGQQAWCDLIAGFGAMTAALGFFESCTPGYYNNEGQGSGGLSSGVYAAGINSFNELLVAWREQGDLEGMELDRAD